MIDNPRWEYCKCNSEEELRRLGEEGWEAYSVYYYGCRTIYYLKRRCA